MRAGRDRFSGGAKTPGRASLSLVEISRDR